MSDNWQKLGDVVARVPHLAPVVLTVEFDGPLAVALYAEAMKGGNLPQTIVREAVRAYLGDAA
ncbi:hypothetical protein IVB27_32355 [Bradyrhizobium sp. 197]|uniref:hypothetical protein n=1 Tax=Bradyrhizobium sp. 197 TaxID=2782663 RepID=UPI001FF8CC43|nr:hypothetical protein [Bradyrhizobium sp. 197]MCK1479307.1 hypothetical protein [Bradyrhizobium sp. 197]